jgi:hypothetical protein
VDGSIIVGGVEHYGAIKATLDAGGWQQEPILTFAEAFGGGVDRCALEIDASGKHAVVHRTVLDDGYPYDQIAVLEATGSAWSVIQTDTVYDAPPPNILNPLSIARHLGVFHVAFQWQNAGLVYWNSNELGPSPPYVPKSANDYPDLAVDSTGIVHLGNSGWFSLLDPDGTLDHGALFYGKLEQGTWTQVTVYAFYPDVGSVGPAGIATDSSNHVHFAATLSGPVARGLLHATNATGAWTTEVVDTTGFTGWERPISDIAVIGSELHIVYVRPAGADIELAHARRCAD